VSYDKATGIVLTGSDASPIDETWLTSRLNALWPAHNHGLAELLIALRREFAGDLDALLILLVIGVGTNAENWEQVLDGSMHGEAPRPTNASSLAEITGIPRESVRRKAGKLVARGLLTRCERGEYSLASDIARHSEPGTRAAIKYLLRIFGAV
jgi:hypothetical protein